jgi:hypothetical protein
MARKTVALLGALTIAAATLFAPAASADPRHRGGYYSDGHRGGHYDGRRGYYDGRRGYGYDRGYRHRDDDDDSDAIVAGVVGLALGAVLGSALSQPRTPPPPAHYPPPPRAPYPGGYQGGYYDGPPPGYYEPRLCVQRQETWDPYARRYVTLERRVPC